MHQFLISVIIPNFNHEQYLVQRFDSVVNQTYQNFEVIILDDASTDASFDVINKFALHPKVSHIFRSSKNSGSPFGLWQTGIEIAKGNYIWIAESDDWCGPTFLEELLPLLQNPEVVIVHSNSKLQRQNQFFANDWWDSFQSNNWNENYIQDGKELLQKFGRYKCPVINVSSAVFKKDVIQTHFIPIEFKYCGDWKFWVALFNAGKVGFVAKPLNVFRIHTNSATAVSHSNGIKKLKENIKVIKYAHKLIHQKLMYNQQYDWLLQIWLDHFVYKGEYFLFQNHKVNLPLSFKIVFYPRFIKLIFKRSFKKVRKWL